MYSVIQCIKRHTTLYHEYMVHANCTNNCPKIFGGFERICAWLGCVLVCVWGKILLMPYKLINADADAHASSSST